MNPYRYGDIFRQEVQEQLEADKQAISLFNLEQQIKARELRAREEAERRSATRARAEIYSHLQAPDAIADMVAARSRFDVPLLTADQRVPRKICWMPKGTHEISASTMGGNVFGGTVVCDEIGARKVMADFADFTRDGIRCFIDFFHRDAEAAGWVAGFDWNPTIGITAGVEWTAAGAAAIRDRIFVSFSPTFYLDNTTGRVNGLVRGAAVGALVNTPAFGAAMPPLLATHAMAETLRQTLRANGHPAFLIDCAAGAVEAGASPEAVRTLIESLADRS